jgi:hypothetical protein
MALGSPAHLPDRRGETAPQQQTLNLRVVNLRAVNLRAVNLRAVNLCGVH